MAHRSAIIGLVVLVVIMAGVLYLSRQTPVPAVDSAGVIQNSADETAVRAVVENFGAQLQNVSLLAPDAAQQIATHYAPYVAPELLQTWAASTTQAPGRLTSSPWPERIDTAGVDFPNPGEAVVQASVIEMTSASTTPAGTQPVQITLQNRNNMWLIVQWQPEGPAQQ